MCLYIYICIFIHIYVFVYIYTYIYIYKPANAPDTSISQSALEEALLSGMQHGNIGSRMSSISQAIRSKYL